jgi:hypothetical protein
MLNDFGGYLFFLILLACILLGVLVFIIRKIVKHKRSITKPDPIQCGNLTVLFDMELNAVMIPYVKDKYGMGKATDSPKFLKYPYSKEQLGSTLRLCMKVCQNGTPCTNAELMTNLGFRNWKDFSEGKRNISVHYKEEHGIIFNTTRRNVDGAYQFNQFGFEKVINNNATDKEIGEVVFGLLPRCR